MKTHWGKIKTDEMLNYEGGQTHEIARYDRIMRHRETVELENVRNALIDLKGAVHEPAIRLIFDAERASCDALTKKNPGE